MMQLNVCVNEMAPFKPLSADIKGAITSGSSGPKNEDCQRDDTTDPPDRKVFDVGKHELR